MGEDRALAIVRVGDHDLLYIEPLLLQEPGAIEYHIRLIVQSADVEPSPS